MGTQTRTRLSDFIGRHANAIVAAWEERVRRLPAAEHLPRLQLRDHVPELLTRLAVVLDGAYDGDLDGGLEGLPEIHAVERLDSGFGLRAVVWELTALRDTILDLWEADTDVEAAPLAELRALVNAFDETISASVIGFNRARERTLRALDRVSSAALGTGDLDTFLPRLLTVFMETTEAADTATLFLRGADGELRLRASAGLGAVRALEQGAGAFIQTIAQTRQPHLMKDASTDPATQTALHSQGLHAVYGVPLIHEDQVIGVALMASRTAYDFSASDQQLFRAMAQRATSLIVQAQLLARERDVQRELVRATERLHAIVNTAVDSIITIDKRGTILSVNPATTKIFGYSPDEMVGGNVRMLMPEPDRSRHDGYLDHYHRTGERKIIGIGRETTGLRKNGERFPLELGISELELPEGRLYTGIIRDITQRKRVEDERERLVIELTEAIQTRDRLVAIVSHDLRNPLNAISMTATMLVRREDLDERTAKAATRIHSAAQRANRLIRDLLDFTQARVGGIPLLPGPTDLAVLAQQVVDEIHAAHPDREVTLETEGDARGTWDPDRIAQVIANLAGNAVQHGAPGTPVQVEVRDRGDQVWVAVRNQGNPIPAEELPKLFEPFRRGTEERANGSLGLGLFIAEQIVRGHAGTLRVESSADQGTCFTVQLPRNAPQFDD